MLKTQHFDIYYYPEGEAAARDAARMAERWYARLARVLGHELSSRQPLILYASHPHFEQTNVIESMLGEGTGGVTESFKRRIVMPVGAGPAETDHVLGHELVHAFQYDILGPNLDFPLWFIEGMAEYLSIGSDDPHTAVWLRRSANGSRRSPPSAIRATSPIVLATPSGLTWAAAGATARSRRFSRPLPGPAGSAAAIPSPSSNTSWASAPKSSLRRGTARFCPRCCVRWRIATPTRGAASSSRTMNRRSTSGPC